MVSTCNGLICLLDSGEGSRITVTVANPITGEALVLPPSPTARDYDSHYRLRLGMYGFGCTIPRQDSIRSCTSLSLGGYTRTKCTCSH